ncbi:ABC transporter substrate-binding protein [Enterococcus florum]|uniref:ABC transporter substrate-binding protein n=1 Tax=Enterococcus florum TaxID=2480627 RepID=A0A4V0WPQ1_9ENTE|nr:sugar ABC transporter substrate-binding protein [Enterococcus florum]GCF94639.1 ABC transporter substrate-binding protein [Enterococcus florum]
MKKIGLLCTVLISLTILTGCGGETQENAKSSESTELKTPEKFGVKLENLDSSGTLKGQYEGKKITVATRTGDHETALKEAAKYFEAATGAKVEVQSFPAGNDEEKIQLDLSTSHTFDAVLMPVANIHSYAASNYLKKLDDYKDVADPELDMEDFIPSILDLYGKYDGELYAFPYKPDTQMLFYRKDIFEDEKVKAAYKEKTGNDLTVPKTNEEMIEIAKYFTKSKNSDSPVDYGYISMGSTTNSRAIWMNREGDQMVISKDNQATVNNDATKQAMKTMMELKNYAPKEWTQLGWDEANALFVEGKALMMEQWPGLINSINDENSKVKDKIGFAVTPGESPVLGGWSIAVTSSSKEDELAYKFIEFVTSKDGELLKVEHTMDPVRQSNYERGEVMSSNEMYPVLLDSLTKGKQLVDADVPYISAQLNDILEDQTQSLLNGKQDIDKTTNNMQKKLKEEIDRAELE